MDFCARPDLIPVETAQSLMQQALEPILESETVSLLDSLDRVLTLSLYSDVNVPSADNSAMDGYAFKLTDDLSTLRVVGDSLAGHAYTSEIGFGECVRITTGGIIPKGADTVIMQEQVERNGNVIRINVHPILGENIRRAGEDMTQGSVVLSKGHRITPIDIGLIASLGITEVQVYRRLKVALISTGDELTPLGKPIEDGKIYDSNRYTLNALLQRLHVETIDLGLQPDAPEIIKASFKRAMEIADVVISTGGVSVGDADFTKDVLEELGNIYFWKVAIKPGKPFAFGKIGNCWFFGLPGNPVSAAITYHQLVLPSLRYLSGEIFNSEPRLNAITQQKFSKQPGRADYQRGILTSENDKNYVASTGIQGSGVLTSLAKANCFIVLEQERGKVEKDETVKILPFDKFIL